MKKWIIALALFNFLDAASTLTAVGFGLAHEVNPLMRVLLRSSPWVFGLAKLSLCLLLVPLWDSRFSRAGRLALMATTAVYLLLIIWHCVNWVIIISVTP